jgi:ferrochelatase
MAENAYLIVNFGGPRTLKEIEPFLRALLTDKDVIRTRMPQVFHNYIFGRVAKKRAGKIAADYAKLGGGSPIWSDTEYCAAELRKKLQAPVLAFHRYLPSTHKSLLEELHHLHAKEICVFPLFPQFTYATTGSVARFFMQHCSKGVVHKLRWVKSYPSHPAYVAAVQNTLKEFLEHRGLNEGEVFFLFSAHGVPKEFIEQGDLYEYECTLSHQAVMQAFPGAHSMLCYQSKFGPGEWLRPYTEDVCREILHHAQGRKYCVFVPISFTSDHIETLFEVEEQYMPLIAKNGLYPFRTPALNRRREWINAIVRILADAAPCTTKMLVRSV